MKYHITLTLTLLLTGLNAQTCLPDSPVQTAYPATEDALYQLFNQHRLKYSEADFQAVKTRIDQCNAGTDRELDGLVAQMSNLSLKYQQVLAYKDVGGIEKQIRDLEESRRKSRAELEQNLGYVKHLGVFAVLLENIDPYDNISALIARANRAITPMAVDDLVGAYLSRATTVEGFAPVRDVVQAFKGGEARAEKEYFNHANFQKNYFLYVAKVGATPLKESPAGANSAEKGLVLNLARDSDFRSRLRSRGVSEEHIIRIEREVLPYLADVQRENTTADSRQDDILQRGTEEIRRLDRELEDVRQRLATRSGKIQAICTEMGVSFNAKNIDASVADALQSLRRQIQELTARWGQTKEREVVVKETRTYIAGTPAKILASETLNTCKQIEQAYGKVDRILQIIEVENLEINRYDANRTLTVYRAPSRVWAYPMPQSDNSFKLAVFVQFHITGQHSAPVDDPGSTKVPAARLPFEPEMVLVEGGSYTMGCTEEQNDGCFGARPAHQVTLRSFYIATTEITQSQWRVIMGSLPPNMSVKGCDQCPVERVSWNDVQKFLKKLNDKTGKKYRLPTEAEWEYAARGGNKSKGFEYAGSNKVHEAAWYNDSKAQPVGRKKANELGLFDMSGNVWEWCSDWYASYSSTAQINPTGPSSGNSRVFRGGSWGSNHWTCTVMMRLGDYPDERAKRVGFRVAQDY